MASNRWSTASFSFKYPTARSPLVVTGGGCGANSSAGGVLRIMSLRNISNNLSLEF
jgi:hypothetical protein